MLADFFKVCLKKKRYIKYFRKNAKYIGFKDLDRDR